MDRRSFIKGGSTAGLGLAINPIGPMVSKALAQTGPIRIGLLAPLTGVVAAGGKEVVEGFNLFWDQHGRKIGNREIEIVVEDDGASPDTALQKARRLVEQRNVHFLVGNLGANTGIAVAEYVRDSLAAA